MRRVILLLFILALVAVVPVFSAVSASYPFQVIGYISQDLLPSVDLDNSVLPFDIESSVVSRNESAQTVRGLRIGTYSIMANTRFTLTITHTKLICNTPSAGTPLTTRVDYRLDVFCNTNTFKSCTNSGSDVIPATSIVIKSADVSKIGESPNYIYYVNALSMYVSMTDDAQTLETIEPGSYSSTITFELVSGE